MRVEEGVAIRPHAESKQPIICLKKTFQPSLIFYKSKK